MNKRIEISVNQEDVQNIIDCYEKDIKYIKQLEAKVNQLEEENNSLRTRIKTVKRNRKAETSKVRKLREIITIKDRALHNKNKVLNEVREYIKEKELKDIKGNTLYCEENLIWHELALILVKVGDE